MKTVIQIARNASVEVEKEIVGKIDYGYLILVGITHTDDKETVEKMVNKIINLRIFSDENGKTNLSLADVKGSVLSISQFTLYADCKKGNRPSFTNAAKKDQAIELYEYFNNLIKDKGFKVETGIFGAEMFVNFTNVGPFTILLDSNEL